MARAGITSASGTPRRSGWSRSTVNRFDLIVGEPEARSPVARQLAPQVSVRAEQRVPGEALTPGARLELTQLLERIDPDLGVAAHGQADARRAVGQGRRPAVAQVALGRGTGHHDGAAVRQQLDVGVRHVDPVHDACALAQKARPVQQLDRAAAVLALALLQLAGLLGRVRVPHQPVAVRVAGDRGEPLGGHGANAVGGHPHTNALAAGGPVAEGVHAPEEGLDRRIAEAPLSLSRRKVAAVPAGAVVGGGEHDDGEARAHGRLGHGQRELVVVVVGAPVRPVVDVVELPYGAIAGGGHLREGAPGHVAHRRRVERAGQAVHRVAPGPEVVAARCRRRRALGPPAEVALERVRVGVDHRRHRGGAGRGQILHLSTAA